MGGKGKGGVKNLKKMVTSFMGWPLTVWLYASFLYFFRQNNLLGLYICIHTITNLAVGNEKNMLALFWKWSICRMYYEILKIYQKISKISGNKKTTAKTLFNLLFKPITKNGASIFFSIQFPPIQVRRQQLSKARALSS